MAAQARARARALKSLAAAGALACAFAVSGCGGEAARDDAGPVGADAGSFAMELGQGELSFAPLSDGEALPYEHGPQGGQHVWVAFRMQDLDPARVLVQVTTMVEGHPELELQRRGRVNFEPEADAASAAHVYAGWPAQILDAVMHEGERAHIDVLLEDRAGRRARAAAAITIAAPD
jgi:hypothetical protein